MADDSLVVTRQSHQKASFGSCGGGRNIGIHTLKSEKLESIETLSNHKFVDDIQFPISVVYDVFFWRPPWHSFQIDAESQSLKLKLYYSFVKVSFLYSITNYKENTKIILNSIKCAADQLNKRLYMRRRKIIRRSAKHF